ncbi:hypothetical protein ACNHUS_35350 [Actinomycetes bacterium M1A6_2h]
MTNDDAAHELQRELRTHTTRRLIWVAATLAVGVVAGVSTAMVTGGRVESILSGGRGGYLIGLTAFALGLWIFQPTAPTADLRVGAGSGTVHRRTARFAERATMFRAWQVAQRRYCVDSGFVSAAHVTAALCWFVIAPLAGSSIGTVLGCIALGSFLSYCAYLAAKRAHNQWVGPNPVEFFTDTELAALIPPHQRS